MEEQNTQPQGAPLPGSETAPQQAKEQNTLMGILSYIGPLVLIPLLVVKDDPFVKFHTKQGLILLIISVAVWVIQSMLMVPGLYMILSLVNLGVLILAIIGIINVVKHKEEELPLVGQLAKHLTF